MSASGRQVVLLAPLHRVGRARAGSSGEAQRLRRERLAMRVEAMMGLDGADAGSKPCGLCGETRKLRKSHIVPKFLFRWLKAANKTKALAFTYTKGTARTPAEPMPLSSGIVQDGAKPYLLCLDCERKLSPWERQFSNRVFLPLHNRPMDGSAPRHHDVDYGAWMALFCVSVVWRVLVTTTHNYDKSPPTFRRQVRRAELQWRRFLNGQARSPGSHEVHLMPALEAEGYEGLNRRYLNNIVDSICIAHPSSGEAYVLVKFGWLYLVGAISNPQPTLWWNTKIHSPTGTWSTRREIAVSTTVLDFMQHKAANPDVQMSAPNARPGPPLRVLLRPEGFVD